MKGHNCTTLNKKKERKKKWMPPDSHELNLGREKVLMSPGHRASPPIICNKKSGPFEGLWTCPLAPHPIFPNFHLPDARCHPPTLPHPPGLTLSTSVPLLGKRWSKPSIGLHFCNFAGHMRLGAPMEPKIKMQPLMFNMAEQAAPKGVMQLHKSLQGCQNGQL